MSRIEIHHLTFLFTTLPLKTGTECHYGVATVWCHPDQSRISIWTTYKMLENHDVSEGSLRVLAHVYDDIKYSSNPFPHAVAVAIADDTKWDMYSKALSDLTAWSLLLDKDGKVICPKELAGCNHFKYFGMLGKILWQVKPNGQAPLLTEDLQLGPDSKTSAEEGVNFTSMSIIKGQSQDQKEEEQVEELAGNHDEAGQNTFTPPATLSYT